MRERYAWFGYAPGASKKGPDSAIYHLFKDLALVLKYADSVFSKIPFVSKLKDSIITESVKEFEIARILDPKMKIKHSPR